jgi:hypothetical protein
MGEKDNGISIKGAVERICQEMELDKSPGSYWHSWQLNIAIAIFDALFQKGLVNTDNQGSVRDACNAGAANFLDILTRRVANCDVPQDDVPALEAEIRRFKSGNQPLVELP